MVDRVASSKAFAEANRARLVALCADLVAAPSAQPIGDTTRPIAVVKSFLESHGLTSEIRSLTPSKPNLVCAIQGTERGPHVIFNGHLDTLDPGDEASWSAPVWKLGRDRGRLTGLGIGNMKAGAAALAMALVGLNSLRAQIAGRITLTLVADEVVFGPAGAAFLLDHDPTLLGDMLINAEGPGALNLAVAEKGLLWLALEAEAAPAQGMLTTRGASAVARLAKLLAEIDSWNDDFATPPSSLRSIAAHGFRLSVNTGTIGGGHFISQVAPRVRAEVDCRVPPGMTLEQIEGRLLQTAEALDVNVQRIKGWEPNWTPIEHPLCQAIFAASADVREREPGVVVRLPASDASRWRAHGVPAICYGPQAELVSGVDDYVYEDDVLDCVAVYMAAVLNLCARG